MSIEKGFGLTTNKREWLATNNSQLVGAWNKFCAFDRILYGLCKLCVVTCDSDWN